jgi:hypothetical protein
MAKIFPHRGRRGRRLQPRLAVAEDPVVRRLRIETERRESERLEIGRWARQAQRREARQRLEADLDEIERLAAAAFPWDRLRQRRARIDAIVRFPGSHKRPLTGVAVWWAAIVVHGRSFEPMPDQLSPAAFALLRATCPFNFDLRRIEPLVALLGRFLSCGGDFDARAFREEALGNARAQIERRRQRVSDLTARDEPLVDLGDGWMGFNPELDSDGFLLAPSGKSIQIAPPPRFARLHDGDGQASFRNTARSSLAERRQLGGRFQ